MKVVYLTDQALEYDQGLELFDTAAKWAQHQCRSFVSHHVQDVSDVSLMYDNIAEYRFTDPKDALLFELKWL